MFPKQDHAKRDDDSPASTSSIVSSFGRDLNKDYVVMERLELITGQDLEVDQIKQALCMSNSRFGRPPTVRQLSELMLQEMLPGLPRPFSDVFAPPSGGGSAWSPTQMDNETCQIPIGCPSPTPSWSDPDDQAEDIRPLPSGLRGERLRSTPSVPSLKLHKATSVRRLDMPILSITFDIVH